MFVEEPGAFFAPISDIGLLSSQTIERTADVAKFRRPRHEKIVDIFGIHVILN